MMFMEEEEAKAQQEMQNEISKYSRAGVLSFLEQEWYNFHEEKSAWEQERTNMIKHIEKLEAERKTSENLKRDLLKRIKMLEYALVQERMKYSQDARAPPLMDPTTIEKYKQRKHALDKPAKKNGIMQQYLREFEERTESLLHSVSSFAATLPPPQTHTGPSSISPGSSSSAANSVNKVRIGLLATDNGTGSVDGISPGIIGTGSVRGGGGVALGGGSGGGGGGSGSSSGTSSPVATVGSLSEVREVPELEAQTDKVAQSKKPLFETVQKRASTDIKKQNLLAAAAAFRKKPEESGDKGKDAGKSSSRQPPEPEPKPSKSEADSGGFKLPESLRRKFGATSVDSGPSEPASSASSPAKKDVASTASSNGKTSTEGSDSDSSAGSVSLGGLENLESSLHSDLPRESSGSVSLMSVHRHKQWQPQFTLRHHLDVVRSVSFHQDDPILISGSDDFTVKLWNWRSAGTVGFGSTKVVPADIEPSHTFLGHRGPVYSVAMASNKERCFSAGEDTDVRMWDLPDSSDSDPYAERGKAINFEAGVFKGHKDAVWDLALHPQVSLIASASADNTVRLWDFGAEEGEELKHTWEYKENVVPTTVCFVPAEKRQIVTGDSASSLRIYDVETGALVSQLFASSASAAHDPSTQINKVVVHPTQAVAVTGHENHTLKFWDLRSAQVIHSMVAHQDPVGSLAIQPSGNYLVTAGHGCSLRFWEFTSKNCVQEINAHRKKHDEGIYTVAFHPTQDLLASGGADAIVKVYS